MKYILLTFLLFTGCVRYNTGYAPGPESPFGKWGCIFESVPIGSGGPEYISLDTTHMKYNIEDVFIEDVCISGNCMRLAIRAVFKSDNTLTAGPDTTSPVTTGYSVDGRQMTVVAPADPTWGNLVCMRKK